MSKEQEITKYSKPSTAFAKLKLLFPHDTSLKFDISTRANKKYMVKGDFSNNKWIHFGQMFMEDYTLHQDSFRRNQFQKRNSRWKDTEPNTPAYLSYWILW